MKKGMSIPNKKKTETTKRPYPSAINMKSANPCTMTVRAFFSIMFGRTVNTGGRLLSPFGNTFTFEHSVHSTSTGAWIASLTFLRLK